MMMRTVFANYEKEVAGLIAFVRSEAEPNIFLLRGESGSGKSYLVDHCLTVARDMPSLLLKPVAGADAIPTIFTNMGNRCG